MKYVVILFLTVSTNVYSKENAVQHYSDPLTDDRTSIFTIQGDNGNGELQVRCSTKGFEEKSINEGIVLSFAFRKPEGISKSYDSYVYRVDKGEVIESINGEGKAYFVNVRDVFHTIARFMKGSSLYIRGHLGPSSYTDDFFNLAEFESRYKKACYWHVDYKKYKKSL